MIHKIIPTLFHILIILEIISCSLGMLYLYFEVNYFIYDLFVQITVGYLMLLMLFLLGYSFQSNDFNKEFNLILKSLPMEVIGIISLVFTIIWFILQ